MTIVPNDRVVFGDKLIVTKKDLSRIQSYSSEHSDMRNAKHFIEVVRTMAHLSRVASELQQQAEARGLIYEKIQTEISSITYRVTHELRRLEKECGVSDVSMLESLYISSGSRVSADADYTMALAAIHLLNLSNSDESERLDRFKELHCQSKNRPRLSVLACSSVTMTQDPSVRAVNSRASDSSIDPSGLDLLKSMSSRSREINEMVVKPSYTGDLPRVKLIMERDAVNFFKKRNKKFWNRAALTIASNGILIVG